MEYANLWLYKGEAHLEGSPGSECIGLDEEELILM